MPKRILMVCYYYPPLTDVGCKRSVAFSRHLKDAGWEPYVLSVKNPDTTYCSKGGDEPPGNVPVEYSYSLINPYKFLGKLNGVLYRLLGLFNVSLKRNYFYDLFCVPDIFLGWIPLTLVKGFHSIRKNDIETIYVSCSPFSSAVIGVLLKKLTGKKLVVDFRDPFALEHYRYMGTPAWRFFLNKKIERILLSHADRFIVTTDFIKDAYIKQYPEVSGKICRIYNGFDSSYLPTNETTKFDKFTIVYAGQFYAGYPEMQKYSEAFFGALAKLKRQGHVDETNFQFLFMGEERNDVQDYANKYGLNGLVKTSGRIPYVEILDVIKKSHLQLLRIVEGMIGTKIFDGLALDTPFLATIPGGEAADIVARYSPGSCVDLQASIENTAQLLIESMTKYRQGEVASNDVTGFLGAFSRETLSLEFLSILEGLRS